MVNLPVVLEKKKPANKSSTRQAPITVEQHDDTRIVRKSNEEIGYRIKSGNLSLLSRKLFNVLIWYAQEMRGQEDESGRYCVPVAQIIKDAKSKSNNYDVLRDSLDELQDVRVIRQIKNGGVVSEVLIPSFRIHNVAHEENESTNKGQKKRGGALKLWFMLPPEMKKQILDPEQYTRLPIAQMAALRTTQGLVLYEICRRYVTNPRMVTNRDLWENWYRILTGATPDVEAPPYKYANRDVFKKAVDEVNAVTDLTVVMIEFKEGRSVRELQFEVSLKDQISFDLGPPPIDTMVIGRITAFGITIQDAEKLSARHNEEELIATADLVDQRLSNPALPPVASPAAYFRKALKENYAAGALTLQDAKDKKRLASTAQREEQARAVAEADERDRLARAEAFAEFEALSDTRQQKLLVAFGATLAGPPATAFRKSGVSTKMLKSAFSGWLVRQSEK